MRKTNCQQQRNKLSFVLLPRRNMAANGRLGNMEKTVAVAVVKLVILFHVSRFHVSELLTLTLLSPYPSLCVWERGYFAGGNDG